MGEGETVRTGCQLGKEPSRCRCIIEMNAKRGHFLLPHQEARPLSPSALTAAPTRLLPHERPRVLPKAAKFIYNPHLLVEGTSLRIVARLERHQAQVAQAGGGQPTVPISRASRRLS